MKVLECNIQLLRIHSFNMQKTLGNVNFVFAIVNRLCPVCGSLTVYTKLKLPSAL